MHRALWKLRWTTCCSVPWFLHVGRGGTQSGAAETSGLWYQHARAVFPPATSSRPVSRGPGSRVCPSHTVGGHQTQCDVQPRVAKSWCVLRTGEGGPEIRQAASALSGPPETNHWVLDQGATPTSYLTVCVCPSHYPLANVTPCSHLVSVSSAAGPYRLHPVLQCYTSVYTDPQAPRRPPGRGNPAWLLIPVHIFNKASYSVSLEPRLLTWALGGGLSRVCNWCPTPEGFSAPH